VESPDDFKQGRRKHIASSIRRHNPFNFERIKPSRNNSETDVAVNPSHFGSAVMTVDFAKEKGSKEMPEDKVDGGSTEHHENTVPVAQPVLIGPHELATQPVMQAEVTEALQARYAERSR
jgi:hypothetical protein